MTTQPIPDSSELHPTDNPVRDLADVIRAIAMAHATGYPIDQTIASALKLANRLDPPTM